MFLVFLFFNLKPRSFATVTLDNFCLKVSSLLKMYFFVLDFESNVVKCNSHPCGKRSEVYLAFVLNQTTVLPTERLACLWIKKQS